MISDKNIKFSLLLVPLKSVPKRKPITKKIMDATIRNVVLVVLVIDDYYF